MSAKRISIKYSVSFLAWLCFASFLVGCADEPERYNILGTTYGWPAKNIHVISDIKINDLQVRIAENSSDKKTCASGEPSQWVELTGPIGPDSSEVVQRIMKKLRRCIAKDGRSVANRVYLSSDGGTLVDGFKMGDVFRQNGVKTIVPGDAVCASACAVAFLGGVWRDMGPAAGLLFHSPYLLAGVGIDCSDHGQVAQLRTYFQSKLGPSDGDFLMSRTMIYCSADGGWLINAGAAKLFSIVNVRN